MFGYIAWPFAILLPFVIGIVLLATSESVWSHKGNSGYFARRGNWRAAAALALIGGVFFVSVGFGVATYAQHRHDCHSYSYMNCGK